MSACCWQADTRIINPLLRWFQRLATGSLDSSFGVLFEEQSTDQSDDGIVVGKNTGDDLCALLEFAAETLDCIWCCKARSSGPWEGRVGEHGLLGGP